MEVSDSIVAVTGAGGFIGHSLCRRLIADKVPVRALVRYRSDLPGEYQFDLANHVIDPAALQPPVRAIVHCGWDMKPGDLAESRRINVEGTQWLFDQCRKAGIEQFVFISSLAAHAGAKSVYGQTKWDTEQKLLAQWERAQFSAVIATGLVIGNGGCFAQARSAVKHRGHLPIFHGLGKRLLPTVFIDDLCNAIISSITKRLTGRLSVADPQGVLLPDFYRGLGLLEGVKPMLLPLPGPGLLPAGASSNLLEGKLLPGDIAQTNRLLGCEPVTGYWRSLERLAAAEGAEDVVAKIRELAGGSGMA